MSNYFLFTFLATLSLVLSVSPNAEDQMVEVALEKDIRDLKSPEISRIIEDCQHDLRENGHLLIPNFLSKMAIDLMNHEIGNKNDWINRDVARTVFQDEGDFDNFKQDSSRNILQRRTVAFVPRSSLPQDGFTIRLYNNPYLVAFFKRITEPFTKIYQSTAGDGSVYGLVIHRGEPRQTTWHVDEHRFSCVYMLQSGESGGKNRHAKLSISEKYKIDGLDSFYWRDYNRLNKILTDDPSISSEIITVDSNDGDVYCFFGDEELHDITKVTGNSDRRVVVFAYSDKEHFIHRDTVKNSNSWDEKKKMGSNADLKSDL